VEPAHRLNFATGWWLSISTGYRVVASPRMLPVLIVKKEQYYFDLRLGQLRNVNYPNRFLDLSKEERAAIQFRLEAGLEPELG